MADTPTNTPAPPATATATDALAASVRDLTAQLQGEAQARLAERAANDPRVLQAYTGLTNAELQSERDARAKAGLSTTQIDQVLAGRNATPTDHTLAREAEQHGVALTPNPHQYATANLGRLTEGVSPEQIAKDRAELGNWAAGLKMSKEMGIAAIERLASVTAQMKGMSPEDRRTWEVKTERDAVESLGARFTRDREAAKSPELPALRKAAAEFLGLDPLEVSVAQAYGARELKQLKEEAHAVLRSGTVTIPEKMLNTPQWSDLWLLRTLSLHGKAQALLASKTKK